MSFAAPLPVDGQPRADAGRDGVGPPSRPDYDFVERNADLWWVELCRRNYNSRHYRQE